MPTTASANKENLMMTTAAAPASMISGVHEIRRRHVSAVNAGDVHASASIFAPNGILLPPGAPALTGTEALHAWFTQVFTNFRPQGFELEPASVDVHGDLAIEHGTWKATFKPKAGPESVQGGGTYLTVFVRLADGSVRVLRDTFNGLPG